MSVAFREVCHLADLDPIAVREHASRTIARAANDDVKPASINIAYAQAFTYEGETLTLSKWAKKLGINYDVLRRRMAKGWTIEQAINEPIPKKGTRIALDRINKMI